MNATSLIEIVPSHIQIINLFLQKAIDLISNPDATVSEIKIALELENRFRLRLNNALQAAAQAEQPPAQPPRTRPTEERLQQLFGQPFQSPNPDPNRAEPPKPSAPPNIPDNIAPHFFILPLTIKQHSQQMTQDPPSAAIPPFPHPCPVSDFSG